MTTKTDYSALDDAIIESIKLGKREFHEMQIGAVQRASSAIAAAENANRAPAQHVETWRITDRRLQAMRKAGRIHYLARSKKNPEGGWNLGRSA